MLNEWFSLVWINVHDLLLKLVVCSINLEHSIGLDRKFLYPTLRINFAQLGRQESREKDKKDSDESDDEKGGKEKAKEKEKKKEKEKSRKEKKERRKKSPRRTKKRRRKTKRKTKIVTRKRAAKERVHLRREFEARRKRKSEWLWLCVALHISGSKFQTRGNTTVGIACRASLQPLCLGPFHDHRWGLTTSFSWDHPQQSMMLEQLFHWLQYHDFIEEDLP